MGWHAKKYANKVGMMHESKVNVLAKPHPYTFFTLLLDSGWESSKMYRKFTNLCTGSSWL